MAGMIDSAFFGDLYSTAEMREVWSDLGLALPEIAWHTTRDGAAEAKATS